MAAAMHIADELQLGHTKQDPVFTVGMRNVRFIYFNPVDCSLKVRIVVFCCDYSSYFFFFSDVRIVCV